MELLAVRKLQSERALTLIGMRDLAAGRDIENLYHILTRGARLDVSPVEVPEANPKGNAEALRAIREIEHSDIDFVGTGVDAFGVHEGVYRSPFSHEAIRHEFLSNNPFFHPTVMFRRRIVESGILSYNEDFLFEEDYELWGRLIPRIKCANLDQSSIRYRVGSNSTQWDPRKYRFKLAALRGFCEHYEIRDPELLAALVELQCAGFVRYEHYRIMRDYARSIQSTDLPRLGWIHHALLTSQDFLEFTKWYRANRGWNDLS
jgi:hypothetical protein